MILHLAYQEEAGGAIAYGRMDAVEAEVQRLCGELEAS